MRLGFSLLLILSAGCAAQTFQDAVANLQTPGKHDIRVIGTMGSIPSSFADDSGEAAIPEPPPTKHQALRFHRMANNRICFVRRALPLDWQAMDPAKDLQVLQKRPFRVEALDTVTGVQRPLVVATAGKPLTEITSMGVSEDIYKGDWHIDSEDRLTNKHDIPMFVFQLCGEAPTMSPATRFIAVTEDGGFAEQRLYLFAITGSGQEPKPEADAPKPN